MRPPTPPPVRPTAPAALAVACATLAAACGGAAPAASNAPLATGDGATDPGAAPAAAPSPAARALDAARTAYGRGDLEGARVALADALDADPTSADARALGARVAAALGRDAAALELLADRTEPPLLALAGRLLIREEHLVTAAERLAPHATDPAETPVLAAYLDVARAGGTHDLYQLGGDDAALPFVDGPPLPVVEVRVGDETLPALVATSADLLVLDGPTAARLPAVEAGGPAGGVARAVALGGATVARVPYVTRDLGPIAAQLGVPVAAVVGLDLLVRLRATIDGPGRRLVVRPGGPPAETPPAEVGVPYATFGGSHLAVRVRLGPEVGGWMVVDSAGAFPLALVPAALDALGVDVARLPAVEGAPGADVRMLALPEVRLGDVLLEEVPAATGLVGDDLGPTLGAPLAGLVGDVVLGRFAVTFDPERRRLIIE